MCARCHECGQYANETGGTRLVEQLCVHLAISVGGTPKASWQNKLCQQLCVYCVNSVGRSKLTEPSPIG
jgi:hypothetical protein